MEIDKAIRIFAIFLDNSFATIGELLKNRNYTSNESSINDWLQVNWEFLVERKVLKFNEYLEVYGEGADYNGDSSRISDPEALPNYIVGVKSKSGGVVSDILNEEEVNLKNVTFDRIVGFDDGFYNFKSDFKYVLINDDDIGIQRVILLDDIEFVLVRL